MGAFYYGGQAVIEGVMMRGQKDVAVAVRQPDGNIHVHEEELPARVYKSAWSKWPFFRGLVMLWDVLILGTRMLLYSANVALAEEKTELTTPVVTVTLLISLSFGIGIFFLGPLLLASGVKQLMHGSNTLVVSLIEGIIRLALFLIYLWAIGRMGDVKRLFSYHGAEHKAINALEDDAIMTPEGVKPYPVAHIRCGTNFLLVVVVTSIFAFALVDAGVAALVGTQGGAAAIIMRILSRIVFVPLVATVAYELIRLGATYRRYTVVRWLLEPGLLLQKLTTSEPDSTQLEVSIAALDAVLAKDGVVPRTS